MPSVFSNRNYVLSDAEVVRRMQGYRQSRQKELANLTLAPSRHPRRQRLHYDGMHNARWVRRRAVCALYIAMADGRDSEKDFSNRISSPRTTYISMTEVERTGCRFCRRFSVRRDISRLPRIDVDEWNVLCAEVESRIVETGWKIRAVCPGVEDIYKERSAAFSET